MIDPQYCEEESKTALCLQKVLRVILIIFALQMFLNFQLNSFCIFQVPSVLVFLFVWTLGYFGSISHSPRALLAYVVINMIWLFFILAMLFVLLFSMLMLLGITLQAESNSEYQQTFNSTYQFSHATTSRLFIRSIGYYPQPGWSNSNNNNTSSSWNVSSSSSSSSMGEEANGAPDFGVSFLENVPLMQIIFISMGVIDIVKLVLWILSIRLARYQRALILQSSATLAAIPPSPSDELKSQQISQQMPVGYVFAQQMTPQNQTFYTPYVHPMYLYAQPTPMNPHQTSDANC